MKLQTFSSASSLVFFSLIISYLFHKSKYELIEDKTAFLNGRPESSNVPPNTELEYLIRFQNTGNDTAFNIVILDTLTAYLNAASVLPGAASHPYTFELLDGHILRFSFKNILLPDSNTNEVASHGFVKFRVPQNATAAIGNEIKNSAAIFFDYNEPVLTNTVTHTIGNEFVINAIELVSEGNIKLFPNPASQYISFTLNTNGNYKFVLYDAQGKLQSVVNFNNPDYKILINHPTGNYFYQLLENSKIVNTGKLIISH